MSVNLDLKSDVVDLTRVICDIESVSGNEKELADAIKGNASENNNFLCVPRVKGYVD